MINYFLAKNNKLQYMIYFTRTSHSYFTEMLHVFLIRVKEKLIIYIYKFTSNHRNACNPAGNKVHLFKVLKEEQIINCINNLISTRNLSLSVQLKCPLPFKLSFNLHFHITILKQKQ